MGTDVFNCGSQLSKQLNLPLVISWIYLNLTHNFITTYSLKCGDVFHSCMQPVFTLGRRLRRFRFLGCGRKTSRPTWPHSLLTVRCLRWKFASTTWSKAGPLCLLSCPSSGVGSSKYLQHFPVVTISQIANNSVEIWAWLCVKLQGWASSSAGICWIPRFARTRGHQSCSCPPIGRECLHHTGGERNAQVSDSASFKILLNIIHFVPELGWLIVIRSVLDFVSRESAEDEVAME